MNNIRMVLYLIRSLSRLLLWSRNLLPPATCEMNILPPKFGSPLNLSRTFCVISSTMSSLSITSTFVLGMNSGVADANYNDLVLFSTLLFGILIRTNLFLSNLCYFRNYLNYQGDLNRLVSNRKLKK